MVKFNIRVQNFPLSGGRPALAGQGASVTILPVFMLRTKHQYSIKVRKTGSRINFPDNVIYSKLDTVLNGIHSPLLIHTVMSESKFYHFPPSGPLYGLRNLDEAVETTREAGFVWFNFYQPSREMLSSLVDKIGIHPLSVEDCFDEKQVPKIEHFANNSFIIFNSFSYKDNSFCTDEIDLFLGKNFLITVSGYNSNERKPLNNIEALVENGNLNVKAGPDFLLHNVLDWLVDQKYKAFDDMEDELESAEELLLEDIERFQPLRLIEMRKNLMRLRKTLYHEMQI